MPTGESVHSLQDSGVSMQKISKFKLIRHQNHCSTKLLALYYWQRRVRRPRKKNIYYVVVNEQFPRLICMQYRSTNSEGKAWEISVFIPWQSKGLINNCNLLAYYFFAWMQWTYYNCWLSRTIKLYVKCFPWTSWRYCMANGKHMDMSSSGKDCYSIM